MKTDALTLIPIAYNSDDLLVKQSAYLLLPIVPEPPVVRFNGYDGTPRILQ